MLTTQYLNDSGGEGLVHALEEFHCHHDGW